MTHPMQQILLIGYGKMGQALAAGWRAHARAEITAVDPAAPKQQGMYFSLESLPRNYQPECIVLAVKPQQMDAVLEKIASRFADAPLYITIAAGLTLNSYIKRLGTRARIVRAMPNTPALVNQGMTALFGTNLTNADRENATALFNAVGKTLWLEREEQMHAVTALSGSGPAYLFHVAEALVAAGKELGLAEETARDLAVQTIAGASALATSQRQESLEQLRKNVTSPGGTTEAALNVLMQNDALTNLLKSALSAADKRSRELAGD